MLKTIFITLGIIFLVLIIAIAIFIALDPFNLKPLLSNLLTGFQTNTPITTGEGDKHPLLSDEQERLLETIGVDVGSLPAQITPEMEKCFTETLGAERVQEIMGGASPGPIDFFKAKGCLGG